MNFILCFLNSYECICSCFMNHWGNLYIIIIIIVLMSSFPFLQRSEFVVWQIFHAWMFFLLPTCTCFQIFSLRHVYIEDCMHCYCIYLDKSIQRSIHTLFLSLTHHIYHLMFTCLLGSNEICCGGYSVSGWPSRCWASPVSK